MPHWIFRDHRLLCLTAATASVVLSLLAIYLDPVINRDGIYYVQAAEKFASGQWGEAFSVYKWPFYSFLVGVFVKLTGLGPGVATYAVNTLLYAVLVVGFVAFIHSLGGRGAVLWIAALIVLFYPALNKFRPFVIRDIGYWACYLWSLAYFFTYIRKGDARLLGIWALLMFLAFLFRIEGLALLLLLPGWLMVTRIGTRWAGAARIAALVIGVLVLSGFTLWQYVSESGTAAGELVSHPFRHVMESWAAAVAEVGGRLSGLEREFGGALSAWISLPVYVGTLLVLIVAESADTLGIVYTGLVAYILFRGRLGFEQSVRYWWTVAVYLQVLLLLAFGLLSFFLADRYPVGLALTLLAPVPFFLEGLWRRWRSRAGGVEWGPLVVGLLLLVSSVEGLDINTQKRYLRDAGLWLHRHGVPEKSLYSNSVILSYYAGLPEMTPRSAYSWDQAMRLIWTDDWRRYDYLAVAINSERSKYEKLILEKIGKRPASQFSNGDGDKVMIFAAGAPGD